MATWEVALLFLIIALFAGKVMALYKLVTIGAELEAVRQKRGKS